MNEFKLMASVIGFGLLNACGFDSENAATMTQNKTEIGLFNVEINGLAQFDQSGPRADGFNYRSDYWEFKANGAKLRMAGRFPDDLPGVEQQSVDLEYNNVYLEFLFLVGKKNTRVSCHAAQEPNGQIKRTVHNDLSNSGSFNIEFVLCRNTYTNEAINEIATPIIVKGSFENAPQKESLF